MTKDPIETAEVIAKEIHSHIEARGHGVFERYPITFALLATFGITAVGTGLKGLIENIPVLSDKPLLLILLGILVLLGTGTLYRRLNK